MLRLGAGVIRSLSFWRYGGNGVIVLCPKFCVVCWFRSCVGVWVGFGV
jgi:hypothetical protein